MNQVAYLETFSVFFYFQVYRKKQKTAHIKYFAIDAVAITKQYTSSSAMMTLFVHKLLALKCAKVIAPVLI